MPFQNADDGGAAADDDCNVVFRAKVDLACLAPSSHLRCSLAFLPDCVLLHFCLKSNSISFDIFLYSYFVLYFYFYLFLTATLAIKEFATRAMLVFNSVHIFNLSSNL